MCADVSRADVTRTITNEDNPHVSAHGGYQLLKNNHQSGPRNVVNIWSTNSLVEILRVNLVWHK